MTFKTVYDYITDKCPQLAPKNTYVIHEWLANGYDAEKDVIPAVDESTKRGTTSIFSFNFFTHAIKQNNAKRVIESKRLKEVPTEQRAKVNAWKRKMDMPYEAEFLNNYEQQNGRVEA